MPEKAVVVAQSVEIAVRGVNAHREMVGPNDSVAVADEMNH